MSEGIKQKSLLNEKYILIILISGAFLIRIIIGTFYYNAFDLESYNIPWALTIREGLFNIYQNFQGADYPPLFFYLLAPLSPFIGKAVALDNWQLKMMLVKLIPIIFDCILVYVVYKIGSEYSKKKALVLSMFWACNISTIINCAFWGQTDSMLLLFIALTFISFQKKQPIDACIFFALGCTAKLQMAYFAPIIILQLCFEYRSVKTVAKSLGMGAAIGLAVWFPFMLASGNAMLPFDIYLGGFNTYNYVNLCAYNIYGIFGNDYVADHKSILGGTFNSEENIMTGGFTYSHLSMLFTILILSVLIFTYIYAWRKKLKIPAALPALFFMNSIFMLTTKMHERYQVPVIILLLLCYLFCKKRQFLYAFIVQTVLTCINQATLLFTANFGGIFRTFYDRTQPWFSVLNVLVYIWILIIIIKYYLHAKKEDSVLPMPIKA